MFRPRTLFVETTPICVFDVVGQEFVGCSYEKTNGKSSSVCFTVTYS